LALAERFMANGLRKKEKRNKSRLYDVELIAKVPLVVDGRLKNNVHYIGYSHDLDQEGSSR